MNINEANNLDENVFFEIFKNIYEHSDFITKLVQKKRPFKNIDGRQSMSQENQSKKQPHQ